MNQSNFLNINSLTNVLPKNKNKQEMINERNLYKIVLVLKGDMWVKIGDSKYYIKPKTVYFISPGQISQLLEYSSETDGLCISFDIDYFLLCLKNQVQLCFYPFFQLDQYPILHLNNTQNDKVLELIKKIAREYTNRQRINDDLLTKLYLNILLIEIERFYKQNNEGRSSDQSRKRLITSKFKQLVEKNFLNIRKVSEYANMLAIAPNYLNDIVRETIGQSASKVIYDRLILEAKAQLIQTEMSINEIAYHLQFKDSSYFCRFFRKQTGVSPQSFRETNHF